MSFFCFQTGLICIGYRSTEFREGSMCVSYSLSVSIPITQLVGGNMKSSVLKYSHYFRENQLPHCAQFDSEQHFLDLWLHRSDSIYTQEATRVSAS